MKKLFFVLAAIVGLSTLGFSDWRDSVPIGPDNALQSADYGGVMVSSGGIRHSSAPLFIPGPATVYGVVWSSNTQRELPFYVQFDIIEVSTLSTVYTSTSSSIEVARLYYSSAIASGNNGTLSNVWGDQKWFKYPLYSDTGWIVRPSTQTFNSIAIPFNRSRRK